MTAMTTTTHASRAKRILVVDDVPDVLSLFRDAARRLRGIDAEIVTEVNALRAIERLQHEQFDIVLSDCRMREADGIAVLSAARATNPRGIRVLMTAYSSIPAEVGRVEGMSADVYLHKPAPASDVLKLLRALLAEDAGVIEEKRDQARAFEQAAKAAGDSVRIR